LASVIRALQRARIFGGSIGVAAWKNDNPPGVLSGVLLALDGTF
jgi:hypothetical protein